MITRPPRIATIETILLPGGDGVTPIVGTGFVPGPHVVAMSVTVDLMVQAPGNDDHTDNDEVIVDFGPLWDPGRPATPLFLQATSMVSWGEIRSPDSDEVDHTTFGIRVITGHRDFVVAGSAVRQLRARVTMTTQGEQNHWRRIGFQTIANGTLLAPANLLNPQPPLDPANLEDPANLRVNGTLPLPDNPDR